MIGQKGLPAHSGGVERHVEDVSIRLAHSGTDVVCYARRAYARGRSYPATYQGVTLRYIPTIQSKHFETIIHVFLSTLNAICDRRVTVIHYHGIGPALFSWIPRIARPTVRVIATFHCQDYYHQKWGVFARAAFRLGEFFACTVAHETIAVSQLIRDYIFKRYGRRARYIPNAVPLREHRAARTIASLGLARDSYILCVARLVRHKGLHTVIESYRAAVLSGARLPKLAIAGANAYTKSYEQELKKAADGCPSVIFLGEQTGEVLSELYSNAALFVQASESEGLSYTLLEAMSYGCPLIVSDIPEHRELIKDEQLFFRSKDSDDLRQKLIGYFSKPHAVVAASNGNRETVRREYNIEKIMPRVLEVYGVA